MVYIWRGSRRKRLSHGIRNAPKVNQMDSDKAWRQWGKQDPYYGVLSDQRYRKNNRAANMGEFWQSGATHWQMILTNLDRLYGPRHMRIAVDFGCGVGRILKPMSNDYQRVIG